MQNYNYLSLFANKDWHNMAFWHEKYVTLQS